MEKKEIPTVSMFKFFTSAAGILKNPLPFHHSNFEKHGDTFQLHLGFGRKIIFSRDAGFAEYALQKNQKNYKKSPIQTQDMAKYLGEGLLTAEGELWKKQRKLIQPAFHKKQLANLLDSIKSAIVVELDKIRTDQPMDIFPVFNDLAFQTVVKSLFSSAVGQHEINRLQYITEAAQKMLVRELRQPYLGWWFRLRGSIQKHLDLTEEARTILKSIIDERKASGKREDDLLDMLLDARYDDGTAMDEKQLIDEILILFTAGHETTSNALTFTCELLARNVEVQEKIFSEVTKAEQESENLMEFLRACPYTQHVVEESMRLYPPAYFIDRVNIDNDEYEGKSIPKGSSLLFSMYEVHRHPNYWNNPEEFNPGRFEQTKTDAYYPFGAGPRKCIGNNFAMYEMVMAIAELIKRYSIDAENSAIEITPLITLKPKNAVLKFNSRSIESK
ncbi:cytochrome P450 [Salinimicrobium marinum]|uniref:Cytochrome P450 n=1 Tax=Salinimicrobium marinum TaxID=680283 RepID=A0A918S7D4_9FLAO|nr:cytochrome P450 [Salinimicrobium marinum]GHA24262.1 cytochrome P450 [Salinimicrobium marinum]